MLKSSFYIFVFLFLIIFISCEEDPTSVGNELLPDDDLIDFLVLDSYESNIIQESKYYKEDLILGQSERLLLGKKDNLKSTALMRFFVPITVETGKLLDSNKINIISSKVILKPNYVYGDSSSNFNFSVHKINTYWRVDDFDQDSLHLLEYEAQDLAQNLTITDSLITFNIDNDLVLEWMKAELDSTLELTNGLLFIPDEASNKILGFKSYSVSNLDMQPEIEIEYENPGVFEDTLYASITSDVHVVEGDINVTSDGIMVLQGGLGYRSMVRFDLSSIPSNSIINKAELTLFRDLDNSYVGSRAVDTLKAYLVDDFEQSTSLDSLGYFMIRRDTLNTYKGNITGFVQRWMYDEDNSGLSNNGVMIRLYDELESVNKFILYSSQYTDAALRPRLKVIYSRKL